MRRGIIGLLIGGTLAFGLSRIMNVYGLALVDWANQEFLSAGTISTTICTALGAFAGGAFGFIVDLEKGKS